jgi:integrase
MTISKKTKVPNERYIFQHNKENNTYFSIYVCKTSRVIKGLKVQKRLSSISTLQEAKRLRDQWNDRCIKKLDAKERQGHTWGEIVELWVKYWTEHPTRNFNSATLSDHHARMCNWTDSWWNSPVSSLSIGDARDVIKLAFDKNASINLRKDIKRTINIIFKWGFEERKILGMGKSPAKDIEILCPGERRRSEQRPEILTTGQISTLLNIAKSAEHPWYPIWFFAFLTGMRTGEIEALSKDCIELVPLEIARKLDLLKDGDNRKNYGHIRVEKAWKSKIREYGDTKGHYWRLVPINEELYYFLIDHLQDDFGTNEYRCSNDVNKVIHQDRAFPVLPYWKRGDQARVLRLFCESNGIESIKFHTIRACFATHMLALGVPENKVMKIGGWKDVDTMRIYVRLAGILERGATQGLSFMKPDHSFQIDSSLHNIEYVKASQMEYIQESSQDTCFSSSKSEGGVLQLVDSKFND